MHVGHARGAPVRSISGQRRWRALAVFPCIWWIRATLVVDPPSQTRFAGTQPARRTRPIALNDAVLAGTARQPPAGVRRHQPAVLDVALGEAGQLALGVLVVGRDAERDVLGPAPPRAAPSAARVRSVRSSTPATVSEVPSVSHGASATPPGAAIHSTAHGGRDVPQRLRPRRRLRRRLPRGHRADRARRPGHRRHPRHRAPRRARRRARAAPRARVHAGRACTSRSSTPRSARSGARSRCAAPATTSRACSSAPTTGCSGSPRERFGGVVEAVDIGSSPLRLEPVSASFHGRDMFAPVAAHLAARQRRSTRGRRAARSRRARAARAAARARHRRRARRARAARRPLRQRRARRRRPTISPPAGLRRGRAVMRQRPARRAYATTFADVAAGELLLYEDGYRALSLAVNRGSALRRARPRSSTTRSCIAPAAS